MTKSSSKTPNKPPIPQTIARTLEETLERLKQLPVIHEGLQVLRHKLPTRLTYHAYSHTEDVLREVVLFALYDNLPARDIELLAVAATLHDIGFIQTDHKNEPIGATYARGIMLRLGGYSDAEIALVEQMILDTALVLHNGALQQIPHTELSKYLLDADLSNFGRDDFFEKGDLQRQEIGATEAEFRVKTLELLQNHTWLTPAAHKLRQSKKEDNLQALQLTKALTEDQS